MSVALSRANPDRRASALEGRVLDAGEQSLGAAAQPSRRPGIGSYPDRRRGGSAGRLILWGVQLCVQAFSGRQVLDDGRHIFRTRRSVRACLGRVVRVGGLRCVPFWARWGVRGGVATAPSEPGLGTYCSWLVEAFGSVLAGLSPVTYWSASRFVGELEPSPAAWPEAGVGVVEELAP